MTSAVDANAVIAALRTQLSEAQYALAIATARAEQAEAAAPLTPDVVDDPAAEG